MEIVGITHSENFYCAFFGDIFVVLHHLLMLILLYWILIYY